MVGRWHGSLNVPNTPTIKLRLSFAENNRGLATIIAKGQTTSVPICMRRFNDGKFSFILDFSGGQSCEHPGRPVVFHGLLGFDVLSGEARSQEKTYGIWRAFRQPKKE